MVDVISLSIIDLGSLKILCNSDESLIRLAVIKGLGKSGKDVGKHSNFLERDSSREDVGATHFFGVGIMFMYI